MPSKPAPKYTPWRLLSRLRDWASKKHGSHTLVSEILSLQLLLTACAGVFAIAGLYWTSQSSLLHNVDRWALQWVDDLQELGAPLYLNDQPNAFINVERFADRYPELMRVTYFDAAGNVKDSVSNETNESNENGARPIDDETVASLAARAGSERGHVMQRGTDKGQFVLRSVIWTEALTGDGLFGFTGVEIESEIQTIGFVELELDFAPYFDQIAANVKIASLVLLGLLLTMAMISHQLLRRSLRCLSGLQAPIQKLASGVLDVDFPTTRYREISSIVDTLKTTVSTLRQRESKLTRLANHDALTGLYNRARFVEELEREIDRVESEEVVSALLFIDLDQFKYVNDTCGHPAGDKLLVCAARQLRQSVRKHDVVARFGGDEFSILLRDVTRREVRQIGADMLTQMRDFAHVEGSHVFQLQCSIGIAMIRSNKWTADNVLAQADMACHEAKRRGRNRMEFYRVSAKETEQMKEDVGWTQRIKHGLAQDLFVLRYQPIVHVATGKTSHHEVLLRMQMPDGRVISPNAFLPAAERFGLMLDLDYWVIEHAIEALAFHRKSNPSLRFTINLSAHAFEANNLHLRVRDSLQLHGVPANSIVFEITEQVAIRNIAEVEKQVLSLKGLGCKVAIDDFGTGYSSFSHLKQFKFDYLKIDGSFVENLARDPVDQTMVRLFADIGKGLGVPTIAEYVTNATSYALLAKFGINYAQGYHLGRPKAVPELPSVAIPIEILRRNKRRLEEGLDDTDSDHTATNTSRV